MHRETRRSVSSAKGKRKRIPPKRGRQRKESTLMKTTKPNDMAAYLFHQGTNYEAFRYMGFHPSDDGKAVYTVDFDLPATTEATIKIGIPDNDPEKKKINAIITEFNKRYPKITVNTSTFVISNYATTIVQQGRAGLFADIVWCNSSNYYVPVASGYALNLNDYIKQAKEAGAFDYENDFTDAFRKMGKSDGKLYAIARSTDSVVTFYNKEILTTAGVDLSVFKNGWTWDDFLSVCAKLRKYYDDRGETKAYPIDSNIGWESVGYTIIKALGGEMFNENGEFCFTKEVSDKVHAFIKDLVDKRYIPSANDSVTSFESGTGAMLFQSASLDVYQSKATHADKFDVVSFPLIGENPQIGFGFAGYVRICCSIDEAIIARSAEGFKRVMKGFSR